MLYTVQMPTSRPRLTDPPASPVPAGSFLAVDPGLGACGLALFSGRVLVRAGAAVQQSERRGPDAWRRLALEVQAWLGELPCDRVVVELMQDHGQFSADLLELNGVAGAVVATLGKPAKGVLAAEWNGQVPSEVRRLRTAEWVAAQGWWSRVDLATTARFQQDVWSAIGIGRFEIARRR